VNDEIWDVIIVGSGASGLAAAVTAASGNCRVLVLEKDSKLGGTTAYAIGSVTAAGTRLQSDAGITDTVDDFFEDNMKAVSGSGMREKNNEELTRLLVREAGPAVDWIARLGASFVGPFGEPPHRVPRMHNIVPNSKSYISVLNRAALKKGAVIRTNTPVVELTTSGDRVTGVRVKSAGDLRTIVAKRGVILASGDYSSNKKMKAQFMSDKLAQVDGINPLSTGDGHLMAVAVHAGLRNMDASIGPNLRFQSPSRPLWIESLPTFPSIARLMGIVAKHAPKEFFRFIAKRFLTVHTSPSSDVLRKGSLLINKKGRRFANESLPARQLAVAVAEQPDKVAYIFLDARLAQLFSTPPNFVSTAPGIAYATFEDYRVLRKDITHEGQSVLELAERVGIDPGTLEETIKKYNSHATEGKEDEWGRKDLGPGFNTGPFYLLGPLMGCFSSVEGGLRIDLECRVLTEDGKRIPGLYAAGSTGQSGLILPGHGMHIGWALVSGRIAGRSASQGPAEK
jgi:fumarate reductase flavoprotein subunit